MAARILVKFYNNSEDKPNLHLSGFKCIYKVYKGSIFHRFPGHRGKDTSVKQSEVAVNCSILPALGPARENSCVLYFVQGKLVNVRGVLCWAMSVNL
jgi:hypothetical protein